LKKETLLCRQIYTAAIPFEDNGLIIVNYNGIKTKDDAWYDATGGKWVIIDLKGNELFTPIAAKKMQKLNEGMQQLILTTNGVL
jgi:hypothetical protein